MKSIFKTFAFLLVYGWIAAMFVMFVDVSFDESREVAHRIP